MRAPSDSKQVKNLDPNSRLHGQGAQGRQFDSRSVRDIFAEQDLPDRVRRFGPTAALSERGGLRGWGVRGQRLGRTEKASNAFPVFTLTSSLRPLASISRIRYHRWLSGERTQRSARERTSATAVSAGRGLKSPDVPEFLPSPSIPGCAQIPIENFFSLLQHPRRGEVATKDFCGILCVAK